MPICQNPSCNATFPNWIKIDGVSKNLSTRQYCLNCSPWGKHNTKSLSPTNDRLRTKYNWNEIQQYYDQGNTLRECQLHFGFGNTAFAKACKRGVFKLRSLHDATLIASKKGRKRISAANKLLYSRNAKKYGLGGIPRKKCHYKGIRMDSTYELRVAQILDKANVQWIRPAVPDGGVPWVDSKGTPHKYYADFYLPQYSLYLDPKNRYHTMLHIEKIKAVTSQNNIKVKILPLSLIKKWELTGFDISDLNNGYNIENFDLTGNYNKVN